MLLYMIYYLRIWYLHVLAQAGADVHAPSQCMHEKANNILYLPSLLPSLLTLN